MQFKDLSKEEIQRGFKFIDSYLESLPQKWVKYIDLGCKIVRLVGYSDEFLPHIEKQLTFVLREDSEKYDDTLILWKEEDVLSFSKKFISKYPRILMRQKLDTIHMKKYLGINEIPSYIYNTQIIDKDFSKTKPIIDIQAERGFIFANNKESHIYYCGVKNLEPEEYIKEGHLFVQFLNNILKTPTSNLAHGAVIGHKGNGILMCARGQRGKSTLSVLSMMRGFEYVSDDYLILHNNENGELLSSPIYSIITLSPKMYNELYKDLKGSQFVSNNGRKDKYVFNIGNFHDRFKMNYPIKICLFPEIVTDKEPSIRLCTKEEKGRAITHLIQSTLMQVQDLCENNTVKKMYEMVKNYPFYKFHLCHDIEKNTVFLRDFMDNLDKQPKEILSDEKIFTDITYDLANLINSEKGIVYSMNKFTTNIYENILNGISEEAILAELEKYEIKNSNIKQDFKTMIKALENEEIFKYEQTSNSCAKINEEFAEENNYKLSIIKHIEEEYRELIKENENELCIK